MSAAFDMRAWMRGDLPFYTGSKSTPTAPEGKPVRYYGVFMTKRGPRTFVSKTREAAPERIIEIQETTGNALPLAEELLKKYAVLMRRDSEAVAEIPTSPTDLPHIGRVGVHSDGDAMHTAICVGVAGDECMLLFLTSHPSWNPYARPITKDEAPFTGFRWNSTTYLAPVFRHTRNMHWQHRSLPTHRVESLREEFFKPEWVDLITRL